MQGHSLAPALLATTGYGRPNIGLPAVLLGVAITAVVFGVIGFAYWLSQRGGQEGERRSGGQDGKDDGKD